MCQSYIFIRAGPQGQLPGTVGCGDILLSHTDLCWFEFSQKVHPETRMWGSTWGRTEKEEAGTGWVVGHVIAGGSWGSVPPQSSGRWGRKQFQVLRLMCAVLGSLSTHSRLGHVLRPLQVGAWTARPGTTHMPCVVPEGSDGQRACRYWQVED